MEGTPPTDEIIPSSDPEDMEPTNDLGDTHPTNDPEDSSKPQQNESSQSDATSESQTSEHSEAADEYEFNSDDHTNESSIEDTYNADESSDATDVNTDENCSVGEEITESLNDENDEMEDESSLVSRDGELSPAYDIIENTPVMLVEAQLPEIGDIAESQEINEPSKIISPASDILKADFAQGQPIMYKGLPGSGQIASQTPHIDQSHHCNYESAANLVQSPVSPLCTSPTCDCHLTNRSYFPDDFTDEKKPVGAPLKRPYDKIMDMRPGQWVIVKLGEEKFPGMYLKPTEQQFRIALCRPKKSGWQLGSHVDVDRGSIFCITDNPTITDQKGSKSKSKATVFYFNN